MTMNNILCASTVFSNVIILYLYFSNSTSVLIVLYVCYGVLFLGASFVTTNSSRHEMAAVLRNTMEFCEGRCPRKKDSTDKQPLD